MSTENTHFGYIPQYLLNFRQSNASVYEIITPTTKTIVLELPALHTLVKEFRNIVRQLLYAHFDDIQQSMYGRSIDTEIRKYYAFLLRYCISMENQPQELLHLGYIVQLCLILYHPWYRKNRYGLGECEEKLLQLCPGAAGRDKTNDLWTASLALLRLVYPASIRWNMQVYSYVSNPVQLECVANSATIQMVNKPRYTSLVTDLLNVLKNAELVDEIELINILTQSSRNPDPDYDVDTVVDWCVKLVSQPLLSIGKLKNLVEKGQADDNNSSSTNSQAIDKSTLLENIEQYLPASFDINNLRVSGSEMLAVTAALAVHTS